MKYVSKNKFTGTTWEIFIAETRLQPFLTYRGGPLDFESSQLIIKRVIYYLHFPPFDFKENA